MVDFKTIYWITTVILVVLQGPYYYKWHGFGKPNITNLKEILLNTLGSAVGWLAGYFLIFYRMENGLGSYSPEISDLVLFLIAFYGMTGYLPHVLINKLKLGK